MDFAVAESTFLLSGKRSLWKQEQLEVQLQDETARQEELQNYQSYTQSQEYVEDIAKSKLGLAYDNEIIFKEEP